MTISGIEFVRAIKERRFPAGLPPWVEHMRVHEENLLETVESGRIVSKWTPGRQFTVPDGFVQGGLISAIADGAQALALITTHETLEFWVTMDLHTRFSRPIRGGELVTVESRVLTKTASNAVVQTTLTLDENRLAAVVTGGWRPSPTRNAFNPAKPS